MIVHSNWPPEGYEMIPGKCPNEGHACNCIGKCAPTLVKKRSCNCTGHSYPGVNHMAPCCSTPHITWEEWRASLPWYKVAKYRG